MDFLPVFNKINGLKDKRTGHGATHEEVQTVEGLLAVTLPASYRAFLFHFGWAELSGDAIYGTGEDVPAHLDVVGVTISEREEMIPRISPGLIPIMNDGAGNHYCLNCREFSGEECTVVFWDHESTDFQETPIEARSFSEWLEKRLERLRNA